jgi:hypothetical protein
LPCEKCEPLALQPIAKGHERRELRFQALKLIGQLQPTSAGGRIVVV